MLRLENEMKRLEGILRGVDFLRDYENVKTERDRLQAEVQRLKDELAVAEQKASQWWQAYQQALQNQASVNGGLK